MYALRSGAVESRGGAYIQLDALAANFRFAQARARGRLVIGVVKADAYGHGAVPIARALVRAGCRQLAALSLDEALELREAAVAVPLLVLAGAPGKRASTAAIRANLTLVVHDAIGLACARIAARAAGVRARIHIEVDTGMSRRGVPLTEAAALAIDAASSPEILLEGIFTHLSCADDPSHEVSLAQLHAFRGLLAQLRERGIRPALVHAENSAGLLSDFAMALPESTAVRPGLLLYGVSPASHLDLQHELKPVMSVHAPVVQVRELAPGTAVGYGRTFQAPSSMRIATLRFGYADGFPCHAAGHGWVWLRGRKRRVVGRVSMDYITVDIGRAHIVPGDEAVLFGAVHAASPWPRLGVEEAAKHAGTIPYELLVRIGQRVPRIVVDK